MNDLSWHTKAINDVMFNKFDHVRCLYLPQGNSFSPFREVIVIVKMNRYPLDEGRLIGPTTSIPHISNGQVEAVERRYPGA